MKIDLITAGTAGMYCGTCIRDNALAVELLRQGHDVRLIPFYTPTLTDEENVSLDKIFFGGISIFLEQYVPLFRHSPRLLDKLWDSPAVLGALSRLAIRNNPKQLGALTVSMLRGEDGHQTKEFGKLLEWLRSQPSPDVVNLPFTLLIPLAAPLKKALGCPVCCTLQGEDLFLDGLQEPYRSQALELIRAHVQDVDAFLAVSDYYAEYMADYLRIPPEKIHVVPLGINLQGYAAQPRNKTDPFTIGYFARITPEKGLHNLCEAYRFLRQELGLPNARLEVAGYLGPEYKGYLHRLQRDMEGWGLGGEFHYRGVLDRNQKIQFLQGLDVLSVPSDYAEPKGLFLLEAMACGVPVVQPRHGAFPEIIEKAGGGLLVEPDDTESLARGILSLREDPALAKELGRKAAEGVRAHYNVEREAARALEVYNGLVNATATEPAAVAARP